VAVAGGVASVRTPESAARGGTGGNGYAVVISF